MFNKKKIRGKNYRVPRKQKKNLQKQGISTIWIDDDTSKLLIALSKALNMSPEETFEHAVKRYLEKLDCKK